MMIYIADRFQISIEGSKRENTPEGYLVIKDNRLARVGVLEYRKAEIPFIEGAPNTLKDTDTIRVYRGPDELFKPEVLDSFKNQPITFTHPNTLVDAKTAKKAFAGVGTGEVKDDGEFMISDLLIMDEGTIKNVKDGVKEISLGYTADIIWQPGIGVNGEVYDAIQKNIRGNHIAVVPRGRCGSACKISDEQTKHKGDTMPVIVLDGVQYECPEQTKQAFDKAIESNGKQIKSLNDAVEKLEKEVEDKDAEAKKKEDEMQAKLDESEKSKVSDAELDQMVADRAKLVSDAQSVAGEKFVADGLSGDEIRKQVVKDACPELDLESKSMDYINARFDALLEGTSNKKPSAIVDALKDHADDKNVLADSGMSLSEQKRQAMINDNKKNKRGA